MGSPGLPCILCIHAMVSDPGALLDLAGVSLLDTVWSFVLTSTISIVSSCPKF
ncbi:MAG TPA: hypothetical protein PKO23_19720 [Candidatus Hydrogenedentes bacterium]|nr:hypothetical protein [Candidatus Hydrogenedentota bacterium]